MNFDDMKVIWDSQNERPLYAVDEGVLRATVRRSSQRFRNVIVVCHVIILVTWAALAVLYLIDPLIRGEALHRLVAGVILLVLAAGQTVALARRRAGESRFVEPSIRGDLDLAIWRIDYDIAWAHTLRRWYILPFIVAISIDFAFHVNARTIVMWVIVTGLVLAAGRSVDWEIRSVYLPKKRRFEAIRRQLTEGEH